MYNININEKRVYLFKKVLIRIKYFIFFNPSIIRVLLGTILFFVSVIFNLTDSIVYCDSNLLPGLCATLKSWLYGF